MGKLLDSRGNAIASDQEKATGVPDWVRGPVADFPVGFCPSDDANPSDRFYLGDHPPGTGLRAWAIMDGPWRTELTVLDMIGLAAGAFEAVAQAKCPREVAEFIAKQWISLSAQFDTNCAMKANELGRAIRATLH